MSDIATYRFRMAERDQVFGFQCSTDETIPFSMSENIQVISGEKYEGEYVITPTTEGQTIPTNGLTMKDDLTVEAVPSAGQLDAYAYANVEDEECWQIYDNGRVVVNYRDERHGYLNAEQSGWVETQGEFGAIPNSVLNIEFRAEQQLPTQEAITITPTKTEQIAVAKGKFTTGAVKVAPIPNNYGPFDFLGVEPEHVKNLYTYSSALSDTGYNTWTPSTTASAIVSSSTLSPTYAGNTAEYEYYLRWRFDADINYASGTTMKYAPDREIMELWQLVAKRPSSRANIQADNFNGNNCSTYFTAGLLSYYDKNGSYTYTWSATYGFYISATACTFSNSTSDTPTITFKTPTINARCSTTYFTTARAGNVDKANSTVKLIGDLYRVKADTCPSRKMYEYLVDIYNTQL